MSAIAGRPRSIPRASDHRPTEQRARPIVVGVDSSTASRAAIDEAVRLAGELDAPIVFVYVRRGPAGFLGAPFYQRRLTRELARARRELDLALAVARTAGVQAEGEILEGSPKRRISEFARDRDARLVVVRSRRPKLARDVVGRITRWAAGRSLPRLTPAAPIPATLRSPSDDVGRPRAARETVRRAWR